MHWHHVDPATPNCFLAGNDSSLVINIDRTWSRSIFFLMLAARLLCGIVVPEPGPSEGAGTYMRFHVGQRLDPDLLEDLRGLESYVGGFVLRARYCPASFFVISLCADNDIQYSIPPARQSARTCTRDFARTLDEFRRTLSTFDSLCQNDGLWMMIPEARCGEGTGYSWHKATA